MVAEYTALVEDSEMMPCSCEDQKMAPVPTFTRYPPIYLPLVLVPSIVSIGEGGEWFS